MKAISAILTILTINCVFSTHIITIRPNPFKNEEHEVVVGKPFNVVLPSNPSTGYQWKPVFEENAPIKKLKASYSSDPNPEGMVGVGGNSNFSIQIDQAGKHQILFTLQRAGQSPISTVIVDIKAHNDGDKK